MSLLRVIVIGIFLLTFLTLWIGFTRRSNEIYEQKKKAEKAEKVEKVKEKKKRLEAKRKIKKLKGLIREKEKRLVNPDVALALQSLGFKKQESITAAQKAIEELGDVETGKLIKEALKQI